MSAPSAPAGLAAAVADLADRQPALALATGPATADDATAATAGRTDRLDAWLAAEAALTPGLDAKAAAAFLVGRIAHALCGALVALRVRTGLTPDLTADDVAFRRESFRWEVGSVGGVTERYRVTILADGPLAPAEPERLRASVERLHHPLIEAMAARRLLGRAALWRLVADHLAAAYLEAGRGDPRFAALRAEAVVLLSRPRSPLANPLTGFAHIVLPAHDGSAGERDAWFVARGGCCRWYTVEGQEACASCVRRAPADRDARLAALLQTPPGNET